MLELRNITKVYKTKNKEKDKIIAVNHISLNIQDGSVIGLLGPNGAGKSTLIKLILGVLSPTSGEVLINGLDSYCNRVELMKQIGVVFGQRSQLWWDLPALDSYELIRKMYGLEKNAFSNYLDNLVKKMKAEDIVRIPVRFLSLGQRIKCEIIAALCFQPQIIILDEPTIGLDISAKESIRQFLREINKEKKVTIILATHDLSDVEALCDRVIVINHGQVIFDDTQDAIKQMQEKKCQTEITCILSNDSLQLPFECEKYKLGEKTIVKANGTNQEIIKVVNWCLAHGVVEDVTITKQNIEKIICDLYNL